MLQFIFQLIVFTTELMDYLQQKVMWLRRH